MRPEFFKTDIDEQQFRDHARENYELGQPIDPEAIKHPVWVLEAATMNHEMWLVLRDAANARRLNWEPGLYFDESSRNLEEVTVHLADAILAEGKGLWDIDLETQDILRAINPDPHTGIYRVDENTDRELVTELYEELTEIINHNLPDPLYFGYVNEAGGWGVFSYEDEEVEA